MDIGQTTSTCLLLVVLVLVLVSGLGHSLRDVHDMDTIEVEVADNIIHHIDNHQILEANLGRIFRPRPIINRSSPLPNKPVHMIAPTLPKILVFILPLRPPPPPPLSVPVEEIFHQRMKYYHVDLKQVI